jgi:hypothetical protein
LRGDKPHTFFDRVKIVIAQNIARLLHITMESADLVRKRWTDAGQEHVFASFASLNDTEKAELFRQLNVRYIPLNIL